MPVGESLDLLRMLCQDPSKTCKLAVVAMSGQKVSIFSRDEEIESIFQRGLRYGIMRLNPLDLEILDCSTSS